jgi:hypothetical protein
VLAFDRFRQQGGKTARIRGRKEVLPWHGSVNERGGVFRGDDGAPVRKALDQLQRGSAATEQWHDDSSRARVLRAEIVDETHQVDA